MEDSRLKKSETKNLIGDFTNHGGDSDIVSFWLLLLFVAVFFGIAAEEARRPMFSSTSVDARTSAARQFDLSSVEENGATGPVGSRGEKFEPPATGK